MFSFWGLHFTARRAALLGCSFAFCAHVFSLTSWRAQLMRRLGGREEGREWWACFAVLGGLVALYLFVGLLRDVASTSSTVSYEVCNNTAQGAIYVTDDRGYLCRRSQLNPDTGCCVNGERYQCASCNTTSQCCPAYEPCVSCCLSPSTLSKRVELVLENSINPILLKSASNPFEFCRSLCRTSSDSVIGENRYRSEFKYCYAAEPQPSGLSMLIAEKSAKAASIEHHDPPPSKKQAPTITVDIPPPRSVPREGIVSRDGVAYARVASRSAVLGWSALFTFGITALLLAFFYR